MNNILVPVDFSGTSVNALNYAIHLFGPSDIKITVINTFEVRHKTGYLLSMEKVLREDAEREMDNLLDKVIGAHAGLSLETKIYKGDPVKTITEVGRGGPFDLIVMGTKGASGLKEVFLGSVAGGVISHSRIPVLVIPDAFVYNNPKEITLAVSGMPLSSSAVIEPLMKIAALHDSNLHVLHIASKKTPSLEEVLNTLEDLDYKVVYEFGDENVNDRINEFLKENKSDMLCLIRRKKGFFKRLLGESVTLKQSFHSAVPLLVLQN